jgi:4-alpha-glucanotransferase
MTHGPALARDADGDESVAQSKFCAPFPHAYRASSVLLHVTSLPSPYGVGDLGPAAYAWVDRLAAAGQAWWQVLPHLNRHPADAREATWEIIGLAWSSDAALAIAPLQDLLGLGSAARMNVPGRATEQWQWRCTDEALNDPSWQRLHDLTRASGRLAAPRPI